MFSRSMLIAALVCAGIIVPNLMAQKKAEAAAPAKAAPAQPVPAKAAGSKAATVTGSAGVGGKGTGAAAKRTPITTANPGVRTSGSLARASAGRLPATVPAGSHDRMDAKGDAVRILPNGRASDVHDAQLGMDIHNNIAGGRRIDVELADHSHLSYDRGFGFISHSYSYHGRDFQRRNYYYHGRAYNRYYDRYAYRGRYLDVYSPYQYYSGGFYGWVYNPWAVPIAYAWGFGGAPWYGFYGGYFAPAPVYATPSLWLSDFVIGSALASGYQAQLADQAPAGNTGAAVPTPLTDETRQLIADEIKGQIALENMEAQRNAQHQDIEPQSSSIARMLSDGQPHVFVASREFDVIDAAGQACAVSDGDVLQLRNPRGAEATSATLVVIASKGRGAECPGQSTISVSLDELQEMQNGMRSALELGMAAMQSGQGKRGLPAAPPSAMAAPVKADIAENAPPADPAGFRLLEQVPTVADQSEKRVLAATSQAPGPDNAASSAPMVAANVPATHIASVAIGQSTGDIVAEIGEPLRIVNLGPKTVYVYKDMRVTFKAGQVSSVE